MKFTFFSPGKVNKQYFNKANNRVVGGTHKYTKAEWYFYYCQTLKNSKYNNNLVECVLLRVVQENYSLKIHLIANL